MSTSQPPRPPRRPTRRFRPTSPSQDAVPVAERMYTQAELDERIMLRNLELREEVDQYGIDMRKHEEAMAEMVDKVDAKGKIADAAEQELKEEEKKTKKLEKKIKMIEAQDGQTDVAKERDELAEQLKKKSAFAQEIVDEVTSLKVKVQQGAEPGDYDRQCAKVAKLEKKIDDINAARRKKIDNIQAACQKEIDDIKAAHQRKLGDVERAYASSPTVETTEITNLAKQLSREVNKRVAEGKEWAREKAELKQQRAAEIQQEAKKLKEKVLEMKLQMSEKDRQHDAAMAKRYSDRENAEADFRRHVQAKINQELAGHKAMLQTNMQKEYNRVVGHEQMKARTQEGISKRLQEKVSSLEILSKGLQDDVTRLDNDNTVLQKEKEVAEARTTSFQYKLQTMEAEMKSVKRALKTKEAEMEDVNYRHKKIKVEKFGEN